MIFLLAKKPFQIVKKTIIAIFWVSVYMPAWGQEIPKPKNPPRLVNDFADMLSPAEENLLEHKLVAYNDSTSTQITIVIVKSTYPMVISDYAFQLGRKWGVGQGKKNNGVVLLWAPDNTKDLRRLTIQTGYGAEGALPDGICKRIITKTIAPNFREHQWFKGLDQATNEMIARLSGEYKNDTPEDTSNGEIVFLLLLLMILFFVIIYFKSKNNNNRGGGHGSSGWGSIPYTTMSSWGSSSGNWGGGNNDSGGGFGGFGGGSFGGGGASGDY